MSLCCWQSEVQPCDNDSDRRLEVFETNVVSCKHIFDPSQVDRIIGDPPKENTQVLIYEGDPERSDEGNSRKGSTRKPLDLRFSKTVIKRYQAIGRYLE